MPTDNDPLGILGTTVDDKYRIVALAGEGGFSAVYRAEHLVWREPVALKFFTLLRDADEALREHLLDDFIQEGKLMSQLSSRCSAIVQARDVGRLALGGDRWVPFMVLEWFDGASLEEVLAAEVEDQRPARSLREAMLLLEPVAEALDVAHQRNIAHRDLKPANIVIAGDPRATDVPVKVLDFGIAKVMADHQELQDQLTRTGQQMSAFTPTYGAPEQFSRTFGATGPWTDVYAMALILVELLRGGAPALEGSTLFELGGASCRADRRPTPGFWSIDLGDAVEAVFQQALALHCRERYPTMGAFWEALHGSVRAGVAPAVRSRPGQGAEARVAGAVGATEPAPVVRAGQPGDGGAPRHDERLETGPTEAMPGDLPPALAGRRAGGSTSGAVTATAPPAPKGGRPTMVLGAALALGVVVATGVFWFGERDVQTHTGGMVAVPGDTTAAAAAPDAPLEPASASAAEPATSASSPQLVAEPVEPVASAVVTAPAGPQTGPSGFAPPRPPDSPAPVKPSATSPVPPPTASGADPFNPDSWGGRR